MGGIKFTTVTPNQSITGANNGVAPYAGDVIKLGNDLAEAGAPAQLSSEREIKVNTFSVRFQDTGTNFVRIGNTASGRVGISLARVTNFLAIVFDEPAVPANAVTMFGPSGGDLVTAFTTLPSALRVSATRFSVLMPLQVSNYIRGAREVQNNAVSVGVAINTSRILHTNLGAAAAITLTLPSLPVVNENYIFYVLAAFNLNVTTLGGNSIRNGAVLKAPGVAISSATIGDCLHLQYVGAGLWVVISVSGVWV